jgi:MFS family permease
MTAPAAAALPGRLAANWALAVLFLANVFNQADRMLFGVVVDPIRQDLLLSDTQMSLLSGLFFVLFNLVAGLVLARAIDRGNRVRILAIGVAAWSLATAAQGFAEGFWSLAAARIAVGVGEATAFPAAMSLIPDLFKVQARGRAVAVFQSSTFVGIVGGTVVAGVLGATLGWRMMFVACGLAGFVAVALLLTVREPERGQADRVVPDGETYLSGMAAAFTRVLRLPGMPALLVGFGLTAMMTSVLAAWGPAFLLRSHGVPLAQVGIVIGPSVGFGGIVGTIAGGIMADRLVRRRGTPSAALLIPLICAPLSVPFMAGFVFAPSLLAAMACAAVMNAAISASLPPTVSFAVTSADSRDRAMLSTMLLAAAGLIGGALGPFIVGTLSDLWSAEAGSESLRQAMAVMLVMPLLAALFLWRALRKAQEAPAPVAESI